MRLYVFGGFYADLDAEAIKPLDDLCHLPGAQVVLASPFNTHYWVECAVMGSVPGHPLWPIVLEEVAESVRRPTWKMNALQTINPTLHVLSLTGPFMLGRVIRRCQNEPWIHSVFLLPSDTFYPVQWYVMQGIDFAGQNHKNPLDFLLAVAALINNPVLRYHQKDDAAATKELTTENTYVVYIKQGLMAF
jgi:mannosyltransferase OCH1-like enzyme